MHLNSLPVPVHGIEDGLHTTCVFFSSLLLVLMGASAPLRDDRPQQVCLKPLLVSHCPQDYCPFVQKVTFQSALVRAERLLWLPVFAVALPGKQSVTVIDSN